MQTSLLAGKTVLVTGVGDGLGTECAKAVVRDGGNVIIGARSADKLTAIADGLDPTGERVLAHAVDITDPDACDAIVAAAVDRFGSLDGVVQVAAYEFTFGSLMDTDFSTWTTSYDVNVIGSLQLLRSAVPALDGGGSAVFIGTQAALRAGTGGQIGYGASKAALLAAVRYLANDLGPRRIRVNSVLPSWMWGPPVQMYCDIHASNRGTTPDAIADEIRAGIPLGEICEEEEDIADAVAFFLSDRARMVTGQSLLVNGGEHMV